MKTQAKLVKPLRNGQITIPIGFRKQLHIDEQTLLQIEVFGSELRIRPVRITSSGAGSPWFRELYELFAPVRKEASRRVGSEIDRDVQKAVKRVRKPHVSRSA